MIKRYSIFCKKCKRLELDASKLVIKCPQCRVFIDQSHTYIIQSLDGKSLKKITKEQKINEMRHIFPNPTDADKVIKENEQVTLSKDMYFRTLKIEQGGTLIVNGFRLFCDVLINDGDIFDICYDESDSKKVDEFESVIRTLPITQLGQNSEVVNHYMSKEYISRGSLRKQHGFLYGGGNKLSISKIDENTVKRLLNYPGCLMISDSYCSASCGISCEGCGVKGSLSGSFIYITAKSIKGKGRISACGENSVCECKVSKKILNICGSGAGGIIIIITQTKQNDFKNNVKYNAGETKNLKFKGEEGVFRFIEI